jgi:hypothetical protein
MKLVLFFAYGHTHRASSGVVGRVLADPKHGPIPPVCRHLGASFGE